MRNNFFFGKKIASLDIHSPLYLMSKKNSYGGGDIGDLYALVEKANSTGFRMIQLTPIQDTGLHASPYMGVSIFSYNPAHLFTDDLKENEEIKKLKRERLKYLATRPSDFVDYRRLYKFKIAILRASFDRNEKSKIKYSDFAENVLDYAVFKALKYTQKKSWLNWPEDLVKSDSKTIIKNHQGIENEVKFSLYCQMVLAHQWSDLSRYAKSRDIELALDKPIYPIHDSADVWANQELFYLNKDGSLRYLSGCDNPRDPFGPQEWGHAVYKFKKSPRQVVEFFLKSVRFMTKISKVIRLDHTLALIWKYYAIDSRTKEGKHIPALKGKLFNKLLKTFPNVFFIAEDVGFVSKKLVDDPLGKLYIPGIRAPQWTDKRKYTQIDQYPELCVAVTSNHDTKSIFAWWKLLKKSKREIFFRQFKSLSSISDEENVAKIMELVFRSPAQIASITLRDLTMDQRRYNAPGVKNARNWRARMLSKIEDVDFSAIKKIIEETERA